MMIPFEEELSRALREAQTTPEAIYQLLMRQWHGQREWSIPTLNEAAALLTEPKFRDAAWRFFRDLASEAGRCHDDALKTQLTIALFEIIAEPPWIAEDVQLLFTLLDSESTRWAVFSAYERYPRTFLRHIGHYGRGRIPPEEFSSWLATQGLEFSDRGLRFRHDTNVA
jgi:hypothetical protein